MKKAIVIILLAVAALVGYNVLTTGELSLIPSSSLSEEERELESLEAEFQAARKQFAAAGRSAGLTGIDTTADAESARHRIERVHVALRELKKRLTSESARRQAEQLDQSIQEFKKNLR